MRRIFAVAITVILSTSANSQGINNPSTGTSTNTASTIVARDASGNFSAGTITAGGVNLNAATVPANGGYLSAANIPALSGNTLVAARWSTAAVLNTAGVLDFTNNAHVSVFQVLGNNATTSAGYGVLSLANATGVADTAGANIGAISFEYTTNSLTYKNVGYIYMQSVGATANQRGGNMFFGTQANGVAGAATNMQIASNGAILMPNLASSSAAQTGTVCWTTGGGNLTVDTSTTCLLSLEETKNIKGGIGEREAMGIVARLNPIWFSYKPGLTQTDLHEHAGLGAHQVEGVDKRLVGYDAKGKLQGIRYADSITAVNTAAIKGLIEENKDLKSRLAIVESHLGIKTAANDSLFSRVAYVMGW